MYALLPAVLSLSLFLTGCAGCGLFENCKNPFSSTDCSNWDLFDGEGDNSEVPLAPDKDLPRPQLSVHAEEITAIVQDYSVELRNQKRLHLEHARTYYNERGIHTIQLMYSSQDIIELCQARKLIIDVTEGMLDQLNSNPLLIPEFVDQAFYPPNMEIYINFESYFIRYIDPYYIKWICLEDGIIKFYTGDVNDNDKRGWHYKREAYDTSRNIVFYQRLAEDKYKAMHEPDREIFGDKRYYPTTTQPNKILE